MVVIGEVHDNPYHHANQAGAVAALGASALVFEQVTPDIASQITPDLIRKAADLESVLRWEERGWPDFAMYFPIFSAAPDAAIFGGGAPRELVRDAVAHGAAAAFGGSAEIFGLTEAFPEEIQAELERVQREAHCNALPEDMLPGMVEAQRLRDASLARAVIAAQQERIARDAAGPIVVITGNGHAGKTLAVPYLLGLADPQLTVVSVGQFEEAAPVEPDFDFWLVTDAAERDDPCAAFK